MLSILLPQTVLETYFFYKLNLVFNIKTQYTFDVVVIEYKSLLLWPIIVNEDSLIKCI